MESFNARQKSMESHTIAGVLFYSNFSFGAVLSCSERTAASCVKAVDAGTRMVTYAYTFKDGSVLTAIPLIEGFLLQQMAA